jgi:drug/metabolite transporter (DMT)-like permease
MVITDRSLLKVYKKLVGVGWIGFGAGVLWGLSNVVFTLAIQNAQVATVLVILASNPMWSVLFSYILLGEVARIRTIIVGLICIGCIVFIFVESLNNKQPGNNSLLGVICAILAAASFGIYFVLIRVAVMYQKSEPDCNACNIISGITAAITALILGSGVQISTISGEDMLYLVIQGFFGISISFTLLTIGPQYITAPEVCLYSFIETVLGPLWVWLGGYEAPPFYSLYAGAVLLCTLGINGILSLSEGDITRSRNSPVKMSDIQIDAVDFHSSISLVANQRSEENQCTDVDIIYSCPPNVTTNISRACFC